MWRTWLYNVLSGSPGVTALVPVARIYGAGAMSGRPTAPFISIGFGPGLPALTGDGLDRVRSETVDIWAHDDEGGYITIDDILDAVRAAVLAAVPPASGYPAVPLGRSGDLADDILDTLKKSETFNLIRSLA